VLELTGQAETLDSSYLGFWRPTRLAKAIWCAQWTSVTGTIIVVRQANFQ